MLPTRSPNQEILARERAATGTLAAHIEVAPDGTILGADNTDAFLGWAGEQLPKTSAMALLPDRDAALFAEAIEAIRLTHCDVTGYFNLRHRGGHLVPVVAQAQGAFAADGALERIALDVRPT